MAFANNVLPVPGGPISKAPFGIFAPISRNFCGFFKNSTISFNSSTASSTPAISLKILFASYRPFSMACWHDFYPNDMAWLLAPCADLKIKNHKAPIKINGKNACKITLKTNWSRLDLHQYQHFYPSVLVLNLGNPNNMI